MRVTLPENACLTCPHCSFSASAIPSSVVKCQQCSKFWNSWILNSFIKEFGKEGPKFYLKYKDNKKLMSQIGNYGFHYINEAGGLEKWLKCKT